MLGVPREDHATLRGWIEGDGEKKNMAGDPDSTQTGSQVLARLYPYFTRYVEERRADPGEDALSQLATVRFPNGDLPEVLDIVKIAVILFAAGQETTARLISAGMRILTEQPALADALRAEPEAIPNFVEECLRFESPIKCTFRLVLHDTKLSGIDLPEGSVVMAMTGAANLDPRVFEDPTRFDPKRSNARRNLSFGHGEHFCPGASLARTEARISFERLLARMGDLEVSQPEELSYMPSFLVRGLNQLPLRFRNQALR